jgi:hypothetical protein
MVANGGTVSASASWSAAQLFAGEWNGVSSNIFSTHIITPLGSGTVGGGTAGAQASMTLGRQFGGGHYWDGAVAEVVAYNRLLTTTDKTRLYNYFSGRYAVNMSYP